MSRPLPRVSVVVPTYNRARLLELTLGSLQQAEPSVRADFDVIVCDDGSADDTFAVVRRFEPGLDVRYCYQPDRGFRASAARNMGIELARGEVVLFIDAGNLVAPSVVRQHQLAHAASPEPAVAMGLTCGYGDESGELWEMAGAGDPPWWDLVDRHPLVRDRRARTFQSVDYQLDRLAFPWLESIGNNISVPRSALIEVGGFDESFTAWGYEDVELFYRLHQRDVRLRLVRDAPTLHLPHGADPSGHDDEETHNLRQIHHKHWNVVTELYRLRLDPASRDGVMAAMERLSRARLRARYLSIWDAGFLDRLRPISEGRVGVIGADGGELIDLFGATWASDPSEASVAGLRLTHPEVQVQWGLGTATELEPGSLDTIVVTDWWRALPAPVVTALVEEAGRVADTVLLLWTPSRAVPGEAADAVATISALESVVAGRGLRLVPVLEGAASAVYRIERSRDGRWGPDLNGGCGDGAERAAGLARHASRGRGVLRTVPDDEPAGT